MRALLVAFYFPPTTGGGVERLLRFCAHLPAEGVDVEVVAPDDARWLAEDPTSLVRVPAGLRVHRVRYRGPSSRVLPGVRIAAAGPGLPRLVERARLAPRRLLVPDVEVAWLPDVVPAVRRLLASGRFDVLVTTSPPHALTVAGAAVARRTGVPWVADWRDPWLANPDRDGSRALVRAKGAASGPLARRAAAAMAGAACVNGAIAREVRSLNPAIPVAVIPNGAEVDEIRALARRPATELTFAFTGWFFGGRGPDTFLEALAGLLADRPELAGRVRARFAGGFPDAARAAVARLGLGAVVIAGGELPHAAALQAQRDADVLLLFMQDRAGSEAVVPAKTWEYLAAERPVLAIVPPHGAAAAEITAAAAGTVVAPGDVAGARRALAAYADAWLAGTLAVPGLTPAAAERISRSGRARELADLLRDVAARAGR